MAQAKTSDANPSEGSQPRRCPACDSSSARLLGQKQGFDLLVCKRCESLYVSLLPTNESRMHYETGGYYSEDSLVVPWFVTARLEEIIDSFAAYRCSNRLLDVGCGAGSLLAAAKRARWDAEGVEVSLPTAEYLRTNGLKVFAGDLHQAGFPTAHFDVVTAGELIEHVADPSSLVREIARVLRPGGIFWATTPHSKGVSARVLKLNASIICPPEHLHLFSRRGLTDLLKRHGFQRVTIRTEGLNLYELLRVFRRQRQIDFDPKKNEGHERVNSNYRLNEELLKNPRRKLLRNAATAVLRASRLGDSLKVWAER